MPEYQVTIIDENPKLYEVEQAWFNLPGCVQFKFADGSLEWVPWLNIRSIKRKAPDAS